MKETALGLVAGAITTLEAGLAVAVSALVVTVKLDAVIVPAGGLMIPAIASAPFAPLASAQLPPLLASVTVTVGPVLEPLVVVVTAVAVQFV